MPESRAGYEGWSALRRSLPPSSGSRHRISEAPREFGGTLALLEFLLFHRLSQGLKELVLVIQDVVFTEIHHLVEGSLCVRQLPGGIGSFGAINVDIALLQLLGASLYTWKEQKDSR